MTFKQQQALEEALEPQTLYSACTGSIKLHIYGVNTMSSNEKYPIEMKSRICVLCRRRGIIGYPLIWARFTPSNEYNPKKTKWKPICCLSPDQANQINYRNLMVIKVIFSFFVLFALFLLTTLYSDLYNPYVCYYICHY